MGEMADYYIDLLIDMGWSPFKYKTKEQRYVQCKHCGNSALSWSEGKTKGSWILVEANGEHHQCKLVTMAELRKHRK